MALQGTDLALLTARIGVARIGAFRLGFAPDDVEGAGTVGPGEYAWQEVKPEDDGEEWDLMTPWSMCAEPPVASFTDAPDPAYVGQTVNFTDTSTPAAEITLWHWEFGDGASSDQQNPTHVYAHEGVYTVRLWIASPRGSSMATGTVTVEHFVIDFTWIPLEGGIPGERQIQFTATVAGGQAPYTYAWNTGDAGNEVGNPATHWYTQGGGPNPQTFTVVLTVTDNLAHVEQISHAVVVTFNA